MRVLGAITLTHVSTLTLGLPRILGLAASAGGLAAVAADQETRT